MSKPEVITIDDVKYIRADKSALELDGEFVLVRCDRSGVFAGIITKEEGNTAILKNARRLWYWSGAASLSQLALEGTKKPNDCKFPAALPEIRLKDVIEVIPCTKIARSSIESVKIWSA
jgi:hypothetical protein